MSCTCNSDLTEIACSSEGVRSCLVHSSEHKNSPDIHKHELIDQILSDSEMNVLNAELCKRIHKLESAKNKIFLQTRACIKELTELEASAIFKLDCYVKNYTGLLSQSSFTRSQIAEIEKITTSEMFLKPVQIGIGKDIREKLSNDILFEINKDKPEIHLLEYEGEGNDKGYREIECLESDTKPELQLTYFFARKLFEQSMSDVEKEEFKKQHGFKLNVRKVYRIINPVLQEQYDKCKKDIINSGIDPCEEFVFHGTQSEIYHEICQNGFKIGGVDVALRFGQSYGFGIYTAIDAIISINIFKDKKVLLCKGLTGNKSPYVMKTKEELDKTNFQSYFTNFKEARSNFVVFFKKEYVLPYFFIEYD